MFNRRLYRWAIAVAALTAAYPPVFADTTLVAVASDFNKPMTEIAAAFEKETGHSTKLSFGSSGKFFTQIQNGGPFEVYLSASEHYPLELEKSGHAVSGSHFVFAIGKLVLWSLRTDLIDGSAKILETGGFQHLAIANPEHAPYGIRAVETMKHLSVFEKLQSRLVYGENIAQTFQFVSTGNADLGFVALAQVIDVSSGQIGSGSGWLVPDAFHGPFRQMAVLLKSGADNPAAHALLEFLQSPPAQAIIKKYGFGLPE
jgi:molybdate transport system substrate-binding protein